MKSFPAPPATIRNVPHWEEECRQIHARAKDLTEGRITAIQAADTLHVLAIRTFATDDPDLVVFSRLWSELVGLPVGEERRFWSAQALVREDLKIQALEDRWYPLVLRAAVSLVEKYSWALEARANRRGKGNAV
jgi:hypothetical protein